MRTGIIIFVALVLSFYGCNKKPVPSNQYNAITVIDDGASLIESGVYNSLNTDEKSVKVDIAEFPGYSNLSISTSGPRALYVLSVVTKGPVGGVGTYISRDPAICHFEELFSGGIVYTVDSSTFNISKATTTNVTGTFTLWVHNTVKNKVITGSIAANVPAISKI